PHPVGRRAPARPEHDRDVVALDPRGPGQVGRGALGEVEGIGRGCQHARDATAPALPRPPWPPPIAPRRPTARYAPSAVGDRSVTKPAGTWPKRRATSRRAGECD